MFRELCTIGPNLPLFGLFFSASKPNCPAGFDLALRWKDGAQFAISIKLSACNWYIYVCRKKGVKSHPCCLSLSCWEADFIGGGDIFEYASYKLSLWLLIGFAFLVTKALQGNLRRGGGGRKKRPRSLRRKAMPPWFARKLSLVVVIVWLAIVNKASADFCCLVANLTCLSVEIQLSECIESVTMVGGVYCPQYTEKQLRNNKAGQRRNLFNCNSQTCHDCRHAALRIQFEIWKEFVSEILPIAGF